MTTAVKQRKITVKRAVHFVAAALAMVGYGGFTTQLTQAQLVVPRNDYRVCAIRLNGAGISPEAAANACAEALRPRDLAGCVARIERDSRIEATTALSNCTQVRRPSDFATCVVNISTSTDGAANPDILSYCRRSILPVSFGQCVVGLRQALDYAPTQALDKCIDAGEPVREYLPSFIPATTPSVPPTAPVVPATTTPGRK